MAAAPARRQVRGENRWPAAIVVLAASGLQMTLPPWLAFGPHWLLPSLEIALLSALVASSPGRLERRSAALRVGGLALAGLLSLTNVTFAVLLVGDLARAISFSAGDVAPLTRWAKLMMMLQSAVSVAAIALVIARAVNTLG